jgi:hypothetical protein
MNMTMIPKINGQCDHPIPPLYRRTRSRYRLIRRTPSAGFTYRLDRLGPRILGGLRPRCIIFLTLLLDIHTYAVITTVLSTLQ